MQIIFWNTLFTAHQPNLFGRLMFFDHAYGGIDYFCLNEATLDLEKMFNKSGWQTFYVANTSHSRCFDCFKETLCATNVIICSRPSSAAEDPIATIL